MKKIYLRLIKKICFSCLFCIPFYVNAQEASAQNLPPLENNDEVPVMNEELLQTAGPQQPTSASTGYSAGIAQSYASINQEMLIVIDTSYALREMYQLDIAPISFKNKKEAQETFNILNDNLLDFELNYENKKVKMILNLKYAISDWRLKEWNEYLRKKSAFYLSLKK